MAVSVSSKEQAELLDVDARFLLANERTLLAWVRTALALMAGGLALSQLGPPSETQTAFGVLAVIFGIIMAGFGYIRFRAADSAIRNNRLPSSSYGPLLQVLGVVIFGFVIVLIELVKT